MLQLKMLEHFQLIGMAVHIQVCGPLETMELREPRPNVKTNQILILLMCTFSSPDHKHGSCSLQQCCSLTDHTVPSSTIKTRHIVVANATAKQ